MILLKGYQGFALVLLGCLVGGDIYFFQINGIFMFNVQLLPVLRTPEHRLNEIMAF